MIEPACRKPTQRNRAAHALRLLIWLPAIIMPLANAAEPVRIGVLTSHPKTQVLAQWQPLAAALKQSMPERDFSIEAFNYPELNQAVAARQLDFVLTHPSHYILLTSHGGMSAPLAAVAEDIQGKSVTVLGGAIFTQADSTIRSLPGLKGKIIAAAGTESMYGYQAQAYELKRAGIKLPQDARMLFTGALNDSVVEAVLSGRAAAGFVRAGVLESMVHEGRLDMAQVRIINRQPLPDYPAQVSTRLYPGRLFAALPHIDESLSRHVAAALFLLEEKHNATGAMKIHGFAIPADYTLASDMLRELRLPPFDAAPDFTLHDVWRQYRWWIISSLAGGGLILLLAFRVSIFNRKLKDMQGQMADQLTFIEAVIDAEVNGLAVCHGIAEPPYTRFTVWNPSMETLTGYRMDEINRLGWYQTVFTDPEAQEQARQRMERMRRGDHLCSEEWIITRKDGRQRIAQIHTTTVAKDEQGAHTLAIMHDITERKHAEEKSKLSAQLLDSTSDTIFLLDPDGSFVYLNEAAWKSRGYTRDEMMKMNLRELNAPEFNKLLAPRIKALLETGKGRFESAHRCKDGSVMPVEINARVIESGGRKLLLSVIRDITKRKLIEEKLLKSEANLRAILDNTPCLIWLKDMAGRYVAVNDAFFRATGQKQMENVLGKTDLDLWPEELAEKYRTDDAEVITLRQQKHIEEPAFDRGRAIWVETFKTPVIDENGNILGTTGFARDITERKQFEEDLRRSNAELEQFGYAISHDMRQPLRMISSYLQLIEMELAGQLDAEKRGYFDFAIEGAKRIDWMLVALLEYSRVGRTGEPMEWIESRAVLDEALLFLRPAIAEAQARLEIAGDWPRIFANRDEMLRLVQNLAGNAVKFRVSGRAPEITVTGKITGNEWHLCIADNGIGIIPGQIKRLFQVFQRLQLRTAFEGNGVGLALCRKIAESHKGRIWAESAGEGQGSRFCVALPIPQERE